MGKKAGTPKPRHEIAWLAVARGQCACGQSFSVTDRLRNDVGDWKTDDALVAELTALFEKHAKENE